jgi:hypothetical protein
MAGLHFAEKVAVRDLARLSRRKGGVERPDGERDPQQIDEGESPLLFIQIFGRRQTLPLPLFK